MIKSIAQLAFIYVITRTFIELCFPAGKHLLKYIYWSALALTIIIAVGPQITRMTTDLHDVAVTYTKAREGVQSVRNGVDSVVDLPETMESIPYVGVVGKYPPGITFMEKLRPSTVRFSMPVVGPISQIFKGADHHGIDIKVNSGTEVIVSRPGRVASVTFNNPIYGNVVVIDHGEQWQTWYAHLSKVSVTKGQEILSNGVIGLSGGIKGSEGAGNSEGAHLHFEIRQENIAKDPTQWLVK